MTIRLAVICSMISSGLMGCGADEAQEKPHIEENDVTDTENNQAPSRSPVAAAENTTPRVISENKDNPLTGEKSYIRCAACHLADGVGVPGAFPPLKENVLRLAVTEEGRNYLGSVLHKGLIGAIEVDGNRYSGVMPAQYPALNDETAAAVLNYVIFDLNAGAVTSAVNPFSADELKRIRANGFAPGDLPAIRNKLADEE